MSGDGGPRVSQPVSGGEWAEEGEPQSLGLLWGWGVKAAPLLLPTGQLPHHQRPALHAERPRGHVLAVHPPPAAGDHLPPCMLSSFPGGRVPSCSLAVPPSLQSGPLGFSLRTPAPPSSSPVPDSCPGPSPQPCPPSLGPAALPEPSVWVPLSQVNGVLPILPLLFPVLWVLATACGEARVLAQMSKGSPSSLVGFSEASGGTCRRNRDRNYRRSGLCPSEQGQEWECGPLSTQKSLQARPRGGECLGSQHTGGPGAAQMLGALLVWGPPRQLGGLCEGSVLPELPFSPCSWPSSRRILSAATQKPCPLRYTHRADPAPGPFWSPGRPPL